MLDVGELTEVIKRMVKPLKTRITQLVSRSGVLSTDDSKGIQEGKHQLLADEVADQIERFQNYGMTSHPPANSEAVVVFPLGNRDHGIAVVVDNRAFRLKGLEQGEVALYTDEGDSIILKRGNKIEINAVEKVTVNTKEAEVNCEKSTVNATVESNVNTVTAKITATALAEMTAPAINLKGNVLIAGALGVVGAGGSGPTTMTMEGTVNLTGNMNATSDIVSSGGNVSDSTRSMAADRTIYNTHTHNENDSAPNPTGVPNQPQ